MTRDLIFFTMIIIPPLTVLAALVFCIDWKNSKQYILVFSESFIAKFKSSK